MFVINNKEGETKRYLSIKRNAKDVEIQVLMKRNKSISKNSDNSRRRQNNVFYRRLI